MKNAQYKRLVNCFIKTLDQAMKDHKLRAWRDMGWAMMRQRVESNFFNLPKRDQEILTLRFGLEDGITHTLRQVAKEFKLTRERIRQLERKALELLKDYSLIHKIKIEKKFKGRKGKIKLPLKKY